MFAHQSYSTPVRAAATLGVAANATLGRVPIPSAGAHAFTVVLAARTAGSVTAQLQGSVDETVWVDMGDVFDLSSSANGTRYIELDGALAPFLRVALTPAGGFDGTVAVTYYCNSGPLPSLI